MGKMKTGSIQIQVQGGIQSPSSSASLQKMKKRQSPTDYNG